MACRPSAFIHLGNTKKRFVNFNTFEIYLHDKNLAYSKVREIKRITQLFSIIKLLLFGLRVTSVTAIKRHRQ